MNRAYYRLRPPEVNGGGVVRFMGAAEGYAMVRRPGCAPFVVSMREWNRWPMCDAKGEIIA